MAYIYNVTDPRSGITMRTNSNDFAATFANIQREYYAEEAAWLDRLREQGIRTAHPDDGWVKRDTNEVHFCYPQMGGDHVTWPGSIVALGDARKHRLVRITGQRTLRFSIRPMHYWAFEEIPSV